MKEQKELGHGRLLEDPERRAGHRDAHEPGLRRRRARPARISLNRFVELTSTSPAKIFGLFPRKGTIAPGSDADIVDLRSEPDDRRCRRKTLHMKVDYNPYEGRQVTGVTETVLSRGKVVIDQGRFVGRAGAGSFLKRAPR